MEKINRLLKSYNVTPSKVTKISSRVYKIQSQNYMFTLKRSKLNQQGLERWHEVYRIANQSQLTSILPIYMTKEGKLFQQHKGAYYYLSPWKEKKENDEPEHEIESLYRELGTIHYKTKRETQLQKRYLEQVIYKEKENLNNYRSKLLSHVEKFEKRHYMSPFELRVCMQYRDLKQVFRQLDYWYDYYLEDIDDDSIHHTALCHGNLRSSHSIYQNNSTYFINWEQSFFGSPIEDLARYYYNELRYHDSYFEQIIKSFPIYEKYNPLFQSERSLLAIYLLNPSNYIQVINRYSGDDWNSAHPYKIRQLEYSYRRLMQGLSIQDYLYQVREQLQQEQKVEDD